MVWTPEDRGERRHRTRSSDGRSPFQRDRDRILYSSAFRRLAGITQIVRAGEADVFHTRQQHTIKVAQVGRRLAQNCSTLQPDLAVRLGIDDEALEAACLAHDLGHPPFGHVGEKALHDLVVGNGDPEGFEGNAQSFRILTKLALRFTECAGLDLTRATLAATLKYPWYRESGVNGRDAKWGAYKSEEDDFEFARKFHKHSSKTPEAELMDWADDIAYSVHDLEDFHRCGALPWHIILDDEHGERLVKEATRRWYGKPVDGEGRLREAMRNIRDFLSVTYADLISSPYEGTKRQRLELRNLTSALIARYMKATKLREPAEGISCLDVHQDRLDEVRILKQITLDYVINTPALIAQQKGQKRILTELFSMIYEDSKGECPRYLPPRLAYLWEFGDGRARFAADCIASLTETETVGLHARLTGVSSGSVLDPIVR